MESIEIENPSGFACCARATCQRWFTVRRGKRFCSQACKHASRVLRTGSAQRRNRRYRALHPEMAGKIDVGSARAQTAKRRDMSEADFEAQILAQGNRCPIGDHEFSSARGHGAQCPARDHCHLTGKWRAILCSEHNRALGMFHDSPEELQAALAYLQEWREKHATFLRSHNA
jgi:hypothetical protein